MERVPGGRLQEVGRVYVYLQTGLLEYKVHQNLTGTDIYGRYGTSVAGLRDLDQDGFNGTLRCPPRAEPDQTGTARALLLTLHSMYNTPALNRCGHLARPTASHSCPACAIDRQFAHLLWANLVLNESNRLGKKKTKTV
ncbi:hypothetical protein chiPu_0023856 [Chiloscyllium punctatum]|uniref:Uncharacterized protein n=1 Tax=Chiloscyllium punctatum TaxID=137246 RepID=A0A401TAH3_CHIPU|nr:hypothetical protein [Chiloscyllium punctatum]